MIYSVGHLWKIRCELFTKQEIPEEVIKDFRNINDFIEIEDFDCFENISFGVEDKHAKKLSFVCDLIVDSCEEEEIQYIIDSFYFFWKNIEFCAGKVKYYERL